MSKTATTATRKKTAAPAAAPTVHAENTPIIFLGYTEEGADGKLVAGTEYYLGQYWPEDKVYDVKKSPNAKKALDSITVEEFELAPEDGALVVNVEDETAAETVAEEKPAAKARSKKTAPAAEVEQEQEAEQTTALDLSGPVKQFASVKDAIKAAGNPLKAAEALYEGVEGSYIVLGGILAVIQEKESFATLTDAEGNALYVEGQKGFAAYVEKTLGMKYRKAQYLVQTYKIVSVLGITEARLKGIGWTKIKEALSYLLQGGNVEEVLADARSMSIGEFRNAIKKKMAKEGKDVHGNASDSHEYTEYTFSVHNDQAEVVAAALAKAAQALGVTDPAEDPETASQCFAHILTEWLAA